MTAPSIPASSVSKRKRDAEPFVKEGKSVPEGEANSSGDSLASRGARHGNASSELRSVLFRTALWIVLFSAAANLLMLTVPIYLMQLFDRVLVSRSVDTLWTLTLIAALALIVYGIVDGARRLLLGQLGALVQISLSPSAMRELVSDLSTNAVGGASGKIVGNIDTLRSYLGSAAVAPLLDAPWSPLFLLCCFLLHPWLGWVATTSFVLLCILCLSNEALTRRRNRRSQEALRDANRFATNLRANTDAVVAMGFRNALLQSWQKKLDKGLIHWLAANSRQLRLSTVSRVLRLALQIVVLATGAWLVVNEAMGPGAMIAASILVTRALAPIEQLIGSWPQTLNALRSFKELRAALQQPQANVDTPLPEPEGALFVEKLFYAHEHQGAEPLLKGVSFSLGAGESLAIIGPSGSGKTTLARLLLGLLKPGGGSVRLDGVNLSDWPSGHRGKHIGYLPQDIQLIEGTVAENITRFDSSTSQPHDPQTMEGAASSLRDQLFASARLSGAHEAILRLPNAYDSKIGPGGLALSGGERQLVGLARAIYGPVRMVVLDEPNANQDRQGEEALQQTLATLKARRVTTIVIAHRPAMLRHVDKVLVLQDGIATHFGPRDSVLTALNPVQNAAESTNGGGVESTKHKEKSG
ncbi:MAG: type I secretion system permease/ATPase [Pseudomonadota bacterium]